MLTSVFYLSLLSSSTSTYGRRRRVDVVDVWTSSTCGRRRRVDVMVKRNETSSDGRHSKRTS